MLHRLGVIVRPQHPKRMRAVAPELRDETELPVEVGLHRRAWRVGAFVGAAVAVDARAQQAFLAAFQGLAGGAPGSPATYVGMCHIFCDSVEAFQAGFGPHAKEIMGDIPNYTDLSPVLQISEVVVG